jgi:hypothetical protein
MPKNYTKKNGSSFKPDPKKFLFNVDTLYFSASAVNYEYVLSSGLRDLLERGKEQAGKFKDPLTIELELPNYENPIVFEVQATGKTSYSYQIRNHDFAIYFQAHEHENQYPLYVHINQFKLWKDGVIQSYQESLEMLFLLGFEVQTCKPSRIDLCCHSDQFDWILTDLGSFDFPQNMNKPDFFRLDPSTMKFETVMFGNRSRYQMRVYNKYAELFKKNKFHFLQVYEQYGMIPEKVWNVEFEIHRGFLKGLKVDGKLDYFDDMDNLLTEKGLSTLWTMMSTDKFVHHSPFWKVLQLGNEKDENAKCKFYQSNHYITRVKEIDDSFDREVPQIFGRLQKFAVNEDVELGQEEEVAVSKLYDMVSDYLDDPKVFEYTYKKYVKEFMEQKFNQALIKYLHEKEGYEKKKGISFSDRVQDKKSKYVDAEINKTVKKNKKNSRFMGKND